MGRGGRGSPVPPNGIAVQDGEGGPSSEAPGREEPCHPARREAAGPPWEGGPEWGSGPSNLWSRGKSLSSPPGNSGSFNSSPTRRSRYIPESARTAPEPSPAEQRVTFLALTWQASSLPSLTCLHLKSSPSLTNTIGTTVIAAASCGRKFHGFQCERHEGVFPPPFDSAVGRTVGIWMGIRERHVVTLGCRFGAPPTPPGLSQSGWCLWEGSGQDYPSLCLFLFPACRSFSA